jgi:hypothetical protein
MRCVGVSGLVCLFYAMRRCIGACVLVLCDASVFGMLQRT